MDLITCWASVPERGRLPSPGITTLTAQPKAYAAEDKLQGKRQVARGKEKCEQREGEDVPGVMVIVNAKTTLFYPRKRQKEQKWL